MHSTIIPGESIKKINFLATMPVVMTLSIILIFILGISIYFTAANIEAESNNREIQLIQNGINIEISRVNGGVESQTLWDDAVLHLDKRFDKDWKNVAGLRNFLEMMNFVCGKLIVLNI